MTNIQMAVLLATIWIAPHHNALIGRITGLVFIGLAASMGLGWL